MLNKTLDAIWLTLFATLGCCAALMLFFLFVGKVTLSVACEAPQVRSGCATDTECCTAMEDC